MRDIRLRGGWRRQLAVISAVVLVSSACGNLTPESGEAAIGGSVSASGASVSVSGAVETASASGSLGGFMPVSDVESHSAVVEDICQINELLGAESIDWDAVGAIYRDGGASVKGDGSVRTIAGNTTSDRDEPIWNDYVDHYGDPHWIDTFINHAIEGTGPFDGEADAVRKQGAQKGIQNQAMIAWALHEVVAAQSKVAAGETDAAGGAPHNVDEVWAFYHGTQPGCGPYATADKRGDNYGKGTSVNDAMLDLTTKLQQAALNGDEAEYQTHMDGLISQINTTYIQATQRYASKMDSSVSEGDMETARIEQAEGWSFYRVIEPAVANADPAVAELISSVYELSNDPAAGQADAVREALESIYAELGVTKEMIGSLQ